MLEDLPADVAQDAQAHPGDEVIVHVVEQAADDHHRRDRRADHDDAVLALGEDVEKMAQAAADEVILAGGDLRGVRAGRGVVEHGLEQQGNQAIEDRVADARDFAQDEAALVGLEVTGQPEQKGEVSPPGIGDFSVVAGSDGGGTRAAAGAGRAGSVNMDGTGVGITEWPKTRAAGALYNRSRRASRPGPCARRSCCPRRRAWAHRRGRPGG